LSGPLLLLVFLWLPWLPAPDAGRSRQDCLRFRDCLRFQGCPRFNRRAAGFALHCVLVLEIGLFRSNMWRHRPMVHGMTRAWRASSGGPRKGKW